MGQKLNMTVKFTSVDNCKNTDKEKVMQLWAASCGEMSVKEKIIIAVSETPFFV